MLRGIAVILNMLLLVILEVFQGGGISVDISAPTEVTAGVEFQVNVSINKGDLKKFSRLQQILPAGLTATSVESANSDFSFEEKRIRHLWLKLPEEENINLIYTIKPDIRLKGEFAIDGKFSYIEENERRSVTVKSLPIVINPSPEIDPSKVVDLADYEKLISPYTPVDINEPQIACIRQTPSYDRAKDEYLVELLVSKERKERFAKIEEAIPSGYRAEVIDDHDAIFTFKDNKAKFLWMNLPASSIFTVKYKLVPDGKTKSKPKLDGKFSFLEKEKTKSIVILQTGEPVASIDNREAVYALLTRLQDEQLASVDTDPMLANNTEPTNGGTISNTYPIDDDRTTTKVISTKTSRKAGTKIVNKVNSFANKKYQLEPENGIYYRVQIAAGHRQVNIRRYFSRYKLNKQVKIEYHEGWIKYSVGSFPIYKDARDYRVFLWNTTDFDDSFVAAYNNGDRITVQEALMIANHKWYK